MLAFDARMPFGPKNAYWDNILHVMSRCQMEGSITFDSGAWALLLIIIINLARQVTNTKLDLHIQSDLQSW